MVHRLTRSVPLIVTAGSHRPVDRISSQATPTIDDTYGSLVSADRERRGGFRDDVRSSDISLVTVLTPNRLIYEMVGSVSLLVFGMETTGHLMCSKCG